MDASALIQQAVQQAMSSGTPINRIRLQELTGISHGTLAQMIQNAMRAATPPKAKTGPKPAPPPESAAPAKTRRAYHRRVPSEFPPDKPDGRKSEAATAKRLATRALNQQRNAEAAERAVAS